MSNARDRVLLTPELLEVILNNVEEDDLLVNAQRVSLGWNAAITGSIRLQRKLFFQPKPYIPSEEAQYNLILRKKFGPWFAKNGPKAVQYGKDIKPLDWNSSEQACDAFARKEASWRRMYPVQPPATTLKVVKRTYYMRGHHYVRGSVDFPEGVKMGVLYDLVQENIWKPITCFAMEWHMFPVAEDARRDDDGKSDEESNGNVDSDVGKSHSDRKCITLHISHTVQCVRGKIGGHGLGPEFISQAYEKVEIEFNNFDMPNS